MYTISKEFHFSASHTLAHLPMTHPCSRTHGHNYIVIAEFNSNQLNHVGFVIDYRQLESIKEYINGKLDHQDLNEVLDFNPTAENIAKYLFNAFRHTFPQLAAITVKETPKTAARYTPENDPHPDHITPPQDESHPTD